MTASGPMNGFQALHNKNVVSSRAFGTELTNMQAYHQPCLRAAGANHGEEQYKVKDQNLAMHNL